MSLLPPLGLLLLGLLATPTLASALRRDAGYVLSALYLGAAALFAPVAAQVLRGGSVAWSTPWVPALRVDVALRADGLGVVFAAIALLIGAAVFAYSARYLAAGPAHRGFFLVMVAFTAAMLVLVLADDLVLLFVAWELTSLASFLLIAQGGRGGELASMRTLLLTFVGGLSLLVAVGVTIAVTGTTRVADALAHPAWGSHPGITAAVALLVLIAGFSKSAQFPFHVWLPDAMAASTPVSAYLHAAAVVKAGIFLLLRFSPAFHATPVWNGALIVTGLGTAALGAWFALGQHDLKKLMAYSTVSQLGLIVATIGVGTSAALAAAVLATIAHALFKSGLFMMVGVVDHAAGTRDLRRLPALRHELPLSFAVTLVGAASMAGVPPLLGFVSKEALLDALSGAPGAAWTGWAALTGAAAASVLTFAYCAKVALGTFVDAGTRSHDRPIHRPGAALLLPAALPILAGVPLGLVPGVLDPLLGPALAAVHPVGGPVHVALWHGITPALVATLLVFGVGVAAVAARATLLPLVERPVFRGDGVAVLAAGTRAIRRVGVGLARLVAADYPSRHLAAILGAFVAVALPGLVLVAAPGLPAPMPHLSRPVDAVLAVLIAAAVASVCVAGSRLGATVSLSAVGILATVQILALGAPDVGLTQLLVESLTVIVIMLVLQKLPRRFGRTAPRRRAGAAALAALAGLAAGGLMWALVGRRPPSPVGEYLLAEGTPVTGGANIVNVILVEFRALDTLGELAVLGMAGVAIIAVLSTVRSRDLDPVPLSEHPDGRPERHPELPPEAAPPAPALRRPGTPAARAIGLAWGNAVALQLMVRVLAPLLAVTSAVIFWRGHNAPGGGFIAALVGSAIVGLVYLSTSHDRQIGPPRLPLLLIGGGVTTAVGTGLWGLLARGSFLLPLHATVAGIHLTTSMLFDVGVYAAVLGLVMVAFNLLGTSPQAAGPGSEGIRERADEAVEGELPGPLDTVRGERPGEPGRAERPRVGARTVFLATNTPPRELGRPPHGAGAGPVGRDEGKDGR